MHFELSLTYDTNIVPCGILKKERDKIQKKTVIVEDHSTGEEVIKNDSILFRFAQPNRKDSYYK